MLDSPPSIDKIVDDDLKQKAPEEYNALKDMENADKLLQREEQKQIYFGPTAKVKEGDSDDDATRQLKAALDKIEQKKKEKENQKTLVDTLSTNDKGKLQKSLEDDIEKMTAHTIGKAKAEAEAKADAAFETYKNSGLNVQDLRELLAITKLAERQATAKKFGLARPNIISRMRPMKVLRKKSVREFLRYLIKRHALAKAFTRLHTYKGVPSQVKPPDLSTAWHSHRAGRKKEENSSVRKLVNEWNKNYKDITKKQQSALPKFHG